MHPVLIIIGLSCLIIGILVIGAPVKTLRLLGNYSVKIVIGLLLLFFFNVFGGMIGLHLPMNPLTVGVSAFLGVFGIVSLVAIQLLFF